MLLNEKEQAWAWDTGRSWRCSPAAPLQRVGSRGRGAAAGHGELAQRSNGSPEVAGGGGGANGGRRWERVLRGLNTTAISLHVPDPASPPPPARHHSLSPLHSNPRAPTLSLPLCHLLYAPWALCPLVKSPAGLWDPPLPTPASPSQLSLPELSRHPAFCLLRAIVSPDSRRCWTIAVGP